MRILISGATGFIGRALVPRLLRDGHIVTAWVRDEARARSLLGRETRTVSAAAGQAALVEAIQSADALVNLAGAPIAKRWTGAYRRELFESRIGVTRSWVSALRAASPRPKVMLSGSAVGYYGDRGSNELSETASQGRGFLSELTHAWEAEALAASALGLRVAVLRTGIVLGRGGGALGRLLLPFSLGLGGPVAGGRQYMAWIHVADYVDAVALALTDARCEGAINMSAPEPVSSRDFARALGRALNRPAFAPLPAGALRIALGEAADILITGQRTRPALLERVGFGFRFSQLADALEDLVEEPFEVRRVSGEYELIAREVVASPLSVTFPFFAAAENLGLLTPTSLGLRILGASPQMAAGARIDYQVRVGVPLRWRTRISQWEPEASFQDVQEKGPYAKWVHTHSFRTDGNHRTVLEDRVQYRPPFGVLGRVAHALALRRSLAQIFGYRRQIVRLRFGVVDRGTRPPP